MKFYSWINKLEVFSTHSARVYYLSYSVIIADKIIVLMCGFLQSKQKVASYEVFFLIKKEMNMSIS